MCDDEPCPVCGREVIETNVIPENPSPDYGPHAPGIHYVHRRDEISKGRFEVAGCSKYENGEIDRWEPTENGSGSAIDDHKIRTDGGTASSVSEHRLGPHRVPIIECGKCGFAHHYDARKGRCSKCYAFLPEATDEQHEKFTDFLVWNTRHFYADSDCERGGQ